MLTHKILIVSDLHLRDTDFKSIGNYVLAVEQVLRDIIVFCKEQAITHVFFLGDIFDKGYRDIGASHEHRNMFEELDKVLTGGLYTVVGNHFFLERDTNPLLYLMQPNDNYPTRRKSHAKKPLINVVDQLVLGCVQFSFFHYSKENKWYAHKKEVGVKFHHGLYHDDTVVPASIRKEHHIIKEISAEYTQFIYNNIDSATIGHVHTPIGSVSLNVGGRLIPVDIPGGMSVVTSDITQRHQRVKLPVYTVTDDSFTKELFEFDIHTNMLKFYTKKENKIDLEFSGGNMTEVTPAVLQQSLTGYLSLEEYLIQKGVDSFNVRMIQEASRGELALSRAIAYTYKNEGALKK